MSVKRESSVKPLTNKNSVFVLIPMFGGDLLRLQSKSSDDILAAAADEDVEALGPADPPSSVSSSSLSLKALIKESNIPENMPPPGGARCGAGTPKKC